MFPIGERFTTWTTTAPWWTRAARAGPTSDTATPTPAKAMAETPTRAARPRAIVLIVEFPFLRLPNSLHVLRRCPGVRASAMAGLEWHHRRVRIALSGAVTRPTG